MSKAVDVRDPWITLSECFDAVGPIPTLVWGDGIEYLDKEHRERSFLSFFTHDCVTADALGLTRETRVFPDGQHFERVIVRLPPSKEKLQSMLAWAERRLVGARECWIFGHKNEGIRSTEKLLSDIGAEVTCVRMKRRTRVLATRLSPCPIKQLPAPQRKLVPIGDGSVQCVTYPGIFSHGRIDAGTTALIHYLSRHKSRTRVVDLGSGAGPIGLFLARRWPEAEVKLYDRSLLATLAAQEGAALNKIANVTIDAQAVHAIPKEPWHGLIVSNPPFHQGRETRTDLIGDFAAAARRLMRPGASFLVVANRHLPYRNPLSEVFHSVEIVWEDSSFCIWHSKGPRKKG